MLTRRSLTALALPALAAGALLTHAAPAEACGGTFCDVGPQGMPVDQTGENIIFAYNGDSVEVHVQIAYDPDTEASKFSWIVPLTALPEFHVGSQILFDNVLNGTVPFYGFNTTPEFCGDNGGGGGPPQDGGFDTSGASSGGGEETGGGPEIVLKQQVGAFEVTVLKSGDAAELMGWLAENGYQQPEGTEAIVQEYLNEGNLFAAFKLVPGVEPVIHPVVFVYQGTLACVPIRLTRVAAVENMDIRVFFLGDARGIPTNYRHVLVNPLKIDWVNFAANYKEVVTAAVDAFAAEGNAFVTEYAGPSDVISQANLYSPAWSAKDFIGLPVTEVANTLMGQGLLWCSEWDWQCFFNHPLVEGLLANYVPVPAGVEPYDFWQCMSCYEDQIDALAWGDGSAFANDFDVRVVEPGQRALSLLQSKPYVTRMYTTISPHEMMADPEFTENPNLPGVPAMRMAEKLRRCDGHAEYTLPDGRVVFVPNDGAWPDFPQEMPWEEEVDQMAMAGAPQILVTNTAQIDQSLADWNAANKPTYDSLGGDSSGQDGDAGCGCTSGGGGGGLALLGLFSLLGLRRRRG